MNEVLASRYAEVIHRLAIGLEPRDAARLSRVASDLDVRVERPGGVRDARLLRHPSGRWSLRYVPRLPGAVDVLIDDPRRRFVPRRLRVPVVAYADVLAAEGAGEPVPATQRTWRPALFPGAAYPTAAGATGIRGQVVRGGLPARWARVEALVRNTSRVVGRAHGDDRGEFLLVIGADPAAPAELPDALELTIRVRASDPAPAPPPGDGPRDPFWDLPLETVSPPGPDDPVCAGSQPPPGYEPGVGATRDVALAPGRIRSGLPAFDLS